MVSNIDVSYTSHTWLFKFKFIKIKYNLKFSFSVTLGTLQMLNSHAWLVATVLNSGGIEHFRHSRKFHWMLLAQIKQGWPGVNC